MRGSELIRCAIEEIERDSSPWAPELVLQLQHLAHVSVMHEGWIKPSAPRETSLGHKPRGVTVAGHSVQTDAALNALECSD